MNPPTWHSNSCVRRKAINRHAKVSEVWGQNNVVDEIAMPGVYLPVKLVRYVKKTVITDTDRRFYQVGAEPHIREQIVT